MQPQGATDFGIQNQASIVLGLINELKCAEATCILFSMHKNNLSEWVKLKEVLLRRAYSHREISFVTLLLQASTANTLSESCPSIPGLCNLAIRTNDY